MTKQQAFIGNFNEVATKVSKQMAAVTKFFGQKAQSAWQDVGGCCFTVLNDETMHCATVMDSGDLDYEEYLDATNASWASGEHDSLLHVALLEGSAVRTLSFWLIGKGYAYQGLATDKNGPIDWKEISYDAETPVKNPPQEITFETILESLGLDTGWASVLEKVQKARRAASIKH